MHRLLLITVVIALTGAAVSTDAEETNEVDTNDKQKVESGFLQDLDALLQRESEREEEPVITPTASLDDPVISGSSKPPHQNTETTATLMSVKQMKVALLRVGVLPAKLNNFLDRESLADYFYSHNRGRTAAAVAAAAAAAQSKHNESATDGVGLEAAIINAGGKVAEELNDGYISIHPDLPPIPPRSLRPKTRTSVEAPRSADTTRLLNAAAGLTGNAGEGVDFGGVGRLHGLGESMAGGGGGGFGRPRTIKQVVLLGERHSGLGWVTKLLRLNCPAWKVVEPPGLGRHLSQLPRAIGPSSPLSLTATASATTNSSSSSSSSSTPTHIITKTPAASNDEDDEDVDDIQDVFEFDGWNETLVLLVVKDPFTWVATMHDRSSPPVPTRMVATTATASMSEDDSGNFARSSSYHKAATVEHVSSGGSGKGGSGGGQWYTRRGKVTNPNHPDYNEEQEGVRGGKKDASKKRAKKAAAKKKEAKRKHHWKRASTQLERAALERFANTNWMDGEQDNAAARPLTSRRRVESGGGGGGVVECAYASVVAMRTAKLEALFEALQDHEARLKRSRDRASVQKSSRGENRSSSGGGSSSRDSSLSSSPTAPEPAMANNGGGGGGGGGGYSDSDASEMTGERMIAFSAIRFEDLLVDSEATMRAALFRALLPTNSQSNGRRPLLLRQHAHLGQQLEQLVVPWRHRQFWKERLPQEDKDWFDLDHEHHHHSFFGNGGGGEEDAVVASRLERLDPRDAKRLEVKQGRKEELEGHEAAIKKHRTHWHRPREYYVNTAQVISNRFSASAALAVRTQLNETIESHLLALAHHDDGDADIGAAGGWWFNTEAGGRGRRVGQGGGGAPYTTLSATSISININRWLQVDVESRVGGEEGGWSVFQPLHPVIGRSDEDVHQFFASQSSFSLLASLFLPFPHSSGASPPPPSSASSSSVLRLLFARLASAVVKLGTLSVLSTLAGLALLLPVANFYGNRTRRRLLQEQLEQEQRQRGGGEGQQGGGGGSNADDGNGGGDDVGAMLERTVALRSGNQLRQRRRQSSSSSSSSSSTSTDVASSKGNGTSAGASVASVQDFERELSRRMASARESLTVGGSGEVNFAVGDFGGSQDQEQRRRDTLHSRLHRLSDPQAHDQALTESPSAYLDEDDMLALPTTSLMAAAETDAAAVSRWKAQATNNRQQRQQQRQQQQQQQQQQEEAHQTSLPPPSSSSSLSASPMASLSSLPPSPSSDLTGSSRSSKLPRASQGETALTKQQRQRLTSSLPPRSSPRSTVASSSTSSLNAAAVAVGAVAVGAGGGAVGVGGGSSRGRSQRVKEEANALRSAATRRLSSPSSRSPASPQSHSRSRSPSNHSSGESGDDDDLGMVDIGEGGGYFDLYGDLGERIKENGGRVVAASRERVAVHRRNP